MSGAERLRLRRVAPADVELMWAWANEPTVRENSFSTARIPLDSHTRWFESKLADPAVVMWILELDHVPVGQIRYEVEEDRAEVGISVAAEHRGHGYATELLVRSAPLACKLLRVSRLTAFVLEGNEASIGAFVRAGFQRAGREVRGDRVALRLETRCAD